MPAGILNILSAVMVVVGGAMIAAGFGTGSGRLIIVGIAVTTGAFFINHTLYGRKQR